MLDLRPGVRVPIPCRQCAKSMIPFTIKAGIRPVLCPTCGSSTLVRVYAEGDELRVKTAAHLASSILKK